MNLLGGPPATLANPRFPLLLLLLLAAPACAATPAGSLQIDGEQVVRHVKEMTRFGPHPPGSEAQKKVGEYLMAQLKSLGLEVRSQSFEALTPVLGRIPMKNIWGVLPGRRPEVLVLASHYDSKYSPRFTFLGANDGGSSSGLVLELARHLVGQPQEYTLWFLFLDGEEAVLEWTALDSLYGSRALVKHLSASSELERIRALILLDLVGGRSLSLRPESNSTPWLVRIIWEKAAQLGYREIFQPSGRTAAEDDHIPFARAGIPVVDIIDLGYRYWHQSGDTVDKLSPRNLAVVGEVVLASLPRISRHLSGQTTAR